MTEEGADHRRRIREIEDAESDRAKRAEKLPQETRMLLVDRLRRAEERAREDDDGG